MVSPGRGIAKQLSACPFRQVTNYLLTFRTTSNIRLAASHCNDQSGFSAFGASSIDGGPVLTLLRIPKPETASLSTDSSDTFPSPASLVAETNPVDGSLPRWQGQRGHLHTIGLNSRCL